VTKRRGAKSAAEFLAELNSDEARARSMAEQEAIRARREQSARESEQRLIEDLTTAGYPLSSLGALLSTYNPLPPRMVAALFASLEQIGDIAVSDRVVRMLGASASPIEASGLVHLFESTGSESLRYAIANTLAEANVRGAESWLPLALGDPGSGVARQMLALAVARRCSSGVARRVLADVLPTMPAHAAWALSEIAGRGELFALEREYARATGWEKEAIGRAIAVVRRRISESSNDASLDK
jgi:hypothetical protein